jgi:hypothetical protein
MEAELNLSCDILVFPSASYSLLLPSLLIYYCIMPRTNSWKWSMYPQLHRKVSRLLSKENLRFRFHNADDDSTCIKSYDTKVMGRFVCNNHKCATNGWSSKKITITIRMYNNKRYNARVYNQHCKACNSTSRPFLDEKSYADRVAYRIKKWSGIKLDPPHYSGEFTGEHERDLCEGCKAGHCDLG